MPLEAYTRVKERARSRGLPIWQYLLNAVDFYESAMRTYDVREVTKLQNNSYYAIKLTLAVAQYIYKHDEESYQNVKRILAQVWARKHIDVSVLERLIEMYRERRKKSYVRAMFQELVRINIELLSQGQAHKTQQQGE